MYSKMFLTYSAHKKYVSAPKLFPKWSKSRISWCRCIPLYFCLHVGLATTVLKKRNFPPRNLQITLGENFSFWSLYCGWSNMCKKHRHAMYKKAVNMFYIHLSAQQIWDPKPIIWGRLLYTWLESARNLTLEFPVWRQFSESPANCLFPIWQLFLNLRADSSF